LPPIPIKVATPRDLGELLFGELHGMTVRRTVSR